MSRRPQPFVRLLATAALAAALVYVPAALAKGFGPGDIRICNGDRCISVIDRAALDSFSSFYFGPGRPENVRPPAQGSAVFQLRWRDGFVSALVGGPQLDRARVHGVNCGRFRRGSWYRLAPRAAREVRRLSASLSPLRLQLRRVPRSC